MPDEVNEQLHNMRHSAAHLLAAAVLKLWPEAKATIGPAIETGFYYDFEFPEPITDKDLPKIEKQMRRILPNWQSFTSEVVTAAEAQERYKDNPYKLELIDEIAARGEPITLYTAGTFTDLCRGGHVENPARELGAFHLTTLAGAYWRGDETKSMLTRIYGVLFATQEELDQYLQMLEEAKKRDHRKLGQQLDLFTFSPLVGAGLPLFTPRGTVLRDELSRFLQELQEPRGYQKVDIPHLAKPALYETSGHWDKFGEDLFHVRGRKDEAFVVKPMNCPHHTQIYASRPRSYRDLPLRFAEITKVYRDEQAGELLGLARVRSITQDDAHVFCAPDQITTEIGTVMDIIHAFYAAFDFSLDIRLSLRDPAKPEAYLGTAEIWQEAEKSLQQALETRGLPFKAAQGEAAFYGPKIDFTATDSLGRRWQLATVQLDLNMPARFDLTYIAADGTKQTPVMIHRAITGAQERFIAVLLEHYAGWLPLWLSPTQVAVLPISDEQHEYAHLIAQRLQEAGVRTLVDDRSLTIGKKIREAELMKTPVIAVVGKQEAAAQTVSVRSHRSGDEGAQELEAFIAAISEQITARQA